MVWKILNCIHIVFSLGSQGNKICSYATTATNILWTIHNNLFFTLFAQKFWIFILKESSRGDESSANIADAQISPGIFTFLMSIGETNAFKINVTCLLLTYVSPTLGSKLTDTISRYNWSIQTLELKAKNLKRTDIFDRNNRSIQWNKLDNQPNLSADTIERSNKYRIRSISRIYCPPMLVCMSSYSNIKTVFCFCRCWAMSLQRITRPSWFPYPR